jgi:outer membrane protein TolC
MLRISVLNDPSVTRFKLEGKLAHEWVAVAEKAWLALLNISPRSPVVVDLNSVSFVDDPGRDLLAQFHSAGATLVGTGPWIGALIEEITENGSDGRFRPGTWTKGILGLLVFLLLATLAFGQETQPAAASGVLTLDQAVSTALAHNRQLHIAAMEVEKAGLDVELAKTKRLPSLNADLYASGLLAPISFEVDRGTFGTFPDTGPIPSEKTKVTTDPQFNVFLVASLKQPISQLHRIGLGIKASKLSVELNKQDLHARRIDIANKVRVTYYEILRMQSAIKASGTAIEAYKELNRLMASYAVEQTVLRSDVLDVRGRLLAEQQKELSLRHALQAEKEQMNLLLARGPETDFSVESVSKAEFADTDLAGARAKALDQRPELRQAALTVQQAEYDYRIKKAEYIPDVSGFVNYVTPFSNNAAFRNVPTAGVQLSWEFFDWGRKKREVQQRQLTVEQSKQKVDETRSSIMIDVGVKARQLEESRIQLQVAELSQETTQEKVRVITAKFGERAALLRDVLEEQTRLAEVNHQYQEALLSFWNAKAELAKAIGEE